MAATIRPRIAMAILSSIFVQVPNRTELKARFIVLCFGDAYSSTTGVLGFDERLGFPVSFAVDRGLNPLPFEPEANFVILHTHYYIQKRAFCKLKRLKIVVAGDVLAEFDELGVGKPNPAHVSYGADEPDVSSEVSFGGVNAVEAGFVSCWGGCFKPGYSIVKFKLPASKKAFSTLIIP